MCCCRKRISGRGFECLANATTAAKIDHNQELPKLLYIWHEVIMDRMRACISEAIDLAITSDAKKPACEWRFCCVNDELQVASGLLDLQISQTNDSDDMHSMRSSSFKHASGQAINKFATSGASTRTAFPLPGRLQPDIHESLQTMSHFFVDGAPGAQKDAGLVLGHFPGDKVRHVDRDWLHELRIAVRQPLIDNAHLQSIQRNMITGGSGSPTTNVAHRPRARDK